MPLLNPSSRVAVVGGLTMGSSASKAMNTTWKNILHLGVVGKQQGQTRVWP
jgi:hypothetical protein